MIDCKTNPRVSRFIVNCHESTDQTPINALLIFFAILYLIAGFLGILYTIAKEVPLSDFFAGVYSFSEIVQQISSGRICDETILDIWSLPHFIGHSFLVILFYRFKRNNLFAFLFSTGISIVWEFIERIIVLYAYNFACESWGNSISDLIVGMLGSLIALVILNINRPNKVIK